MDDHTRIVLYGASGHGKVVADILELSGRGPVLFWDDKEQTHFAYPVTLPQPGKNSALCIVTVGDNDTRRKLVSTLRMPFATAIHPTAVIARDVMIGEGTVVMAGAVINPGARIGAHCIVNTAAVIEHDSILDDFVHVSPGVHLAGGVSAGQGAHIGIGSNVIQGLTVGKWAATGAGAVIIRDVPDYAVVVGVPGEVIRYNEKEELQ